MSATTDRAATPAEGYGPYLSAEVVATALGVSPRTIHRLVEAGELSALRVGRQRRIPQAELDAFVERHTEPPDAPPETREPGFDRAQGSRDDNDADFSAPPRRD